MSRLLLLATLLGGLPSALAAQSGGDPLLFRTLGAANAPVTVYEMSDFQCPFCRRHSLETFPQIEREYITTGKVRWIFINFPLTSIHPNAVAAHELAMCAGRQGKFWPAHELVFRTQGTWSPLRDPGAFLATLVDSLRLPRAATLRCLERGETRAEVQSDTDGSIRAGANSTPTFYIEGGLLTGAQPMPVFRQVLDSIHRVKTRR